MINVVVQYIHEIKCIYISYYTTLTSLMVTAQQKYTNVTDLRMYSNTAACILCENILKIICKPYIFQLGLNFLWWWTVFIILSVADTLTFLQKENMKPQHNQYPRNDYFRIMDVNGYSGCGSLWCSSFVNNTTYKDAIQCSIYYWQALLIFIFNKWLRTMNTTS
jgi:hypothetical protein